MNKRATARATGRAGSVGHAMTAAEPAADAATPADPSPRRARAGTPAVPPTEAAAAGPAAEPAEGEKASRRAMPRRDARGCFVKADTTLVAGVTPVAGPRRATAKRKPGARSKVPPPARWSTKRREVFLTTLAETANVAASARASRLSESTVYRRRRQDEDFRAAWMAALREGVIALETMLLDRALNGVEKPVWHGGKQVGTMLEYNDRIALALLAHHRGGAADPAESAVAVPIEEMRARLKAKLAEMNLRMGGAG